MVLVLVFACLSCWITLSTKTVVPSAYRMTTFDENLAAGAGGVPRLADDIQTDDDVSPREETPQSQESAPMIYYSAAGSGVAEVRVILSGFVLHGFLGLKTLIIKAVALVLSVASGLSLGKEGPYVHIATCVGNIACRLFSKYDRNDAKRREVLSAAAAAGVTVAFGAPLGGVLFSLEEVSYYFPAKTLFRTFFCCIVAALSLKFLNPYGTHKIVMFEIRYLEDWAYFELIGFIITGILGGALGALFIKASKVWAQSFRRIKIIKRFPILEVFLVALVTGLLSYWNVLTKLPVAKLLLNVASPCDDPNIDRDELGLCPDSIDDIPPILITLLVAFLIKGLLTTITFGIVCDQKRIHSAYSTNPLIESPRWYLRAIHGCRWLDGTHHWPFDAMACPGYSGLGNMGKLCNNVGRNLHSAWRIRPYRGRRHDVRSYQAFRYAGSYSIRDHWQPGLRPSLLPDNSHRQVDGRCD